MTKRIAILISGRGSNMTALIEAAKADDFPAEIALVVSNRADAHGLQRAEEAGIETAVIPHQGKSRAVFDNEISDLLCSRDIDFVCLAGFMRVLSDAFVTAWEGRLLNIHPSLLPLFRGLHVHEQALEAGVAVSGCTVHLVTPELDGGPIVGQAVVPVTEGDTAETLAARVQRAEHLLYPAALRRCLGVDPKPVSAEGLLLSVR